MLATRANQPPPTPSPFHTLHQSALTISPLLKIAHNRVDDNLGEEIHYTTPRLIIAKANYRPGYVGILTPVWRLTGAGRCSGLFLGGNSRVQNASENVGGREVRHGPCGRRAPILVTTSDLCTNSSLLASPSNPDTAGHRVRGGGVAPR